LKLDKPLFPQLFKGIALFTPGGDLIYGIDPSKQGRWHLHLCAALQEILRLPEPPHFLVPGHTATIDRWLDPRTQQLRQSTEVYPPARHHQALLNAVFDTGNLVWQIAPWQEALCDPIVLETYRHQFPQLWEDHDLIMRFDLNQRLPDPYSQFEEAISTDLAKSHKALGVSTRSPQHNTLASHFVHPEGLTNMERYSKFSPQEPEKATDQADIPAHHQADTLNLDQIQLTDLKLETLVTKEKAVYRMPQRQTIPPSQPPLIPNQPQDLESDFQPKSVGSYVLRLFVSGNSTATEHTLKSLHQLLETSLPYPYTLKIIDVFKHPDQAEANQISATPTLLRVWPQPVRRLVGDLTNLELVLRILATPEA
jgi:circadian clock protein KaiB